MKMLDKSEYTTNSQNLHNKPIKIQETEIKRIGERKAFRYLGYYTALSGEWDTHKKRGSRNTPKHNQHTKKHVSRSKDLNKNNKYHSKHTPGIRLSHNPIHRKGIICLYS